jgi:tRNA A-37 threonylcarbamoyl transferase component Bud32
MGFAEINYDIHLPFQAHLNDEDEAVHCREKIRVIPNRRLVCSGSWQEQEVFVKIFAASRTAYRDWQREVAGSKALLQHNISSAQMIYHGQLSEDHGYFRGQQAYIVIYRSIQPALDLDDVWQAAARNERRDLLHKLTHVVAQHHSEGLSQQDMHLRNFVVSGQVIYTLDAADIRIRRSQLNERDSLANLAQLFALISPSDDDLLPEVFNSYIRIRGWDSSERQLDVFMIRVEKLRRTKKAKYIKKVFRESSAFISHRSMGEFTVYDRLFDSNDLRQLLQDPDRFIDEGVIVKRGNTCTIASVKTEMGRLIVKRYNIKNSWHAARRALAPTRASMSWRNAHRLQLCQISSAHPVALLEKSFGPVHLQSYFVMQEVSGPSCWAFFKDPTIAMSDKKEVASGITDLFVQLSSHKISHGDMKATNFIISDSQPVLLDLDAMHEHSSSSAFENAHVRDLHRFFNNWRDTPEVYDLFRESFGRVGFDIQP